MRAPFLAVAFVFALAAACSGSSGGGTTPGGGGAPSPIYQGAFAGSVVPGWDAANPRPLILFGSQNGGADYFTSAHIETNGALDGVVLDQIVTWGWSGSAGPTLLYHGPLVGGTVPGWNASQPRPLIVYVTQNGASGGYTTVSGLIAADGSMSQIAADEIWVWGWNGGAPTVRYDGVLGSALLPSWSASAPKPFLFGVHSASQSGWYDPPLAVQVQSAGGLTNLVTDRVVIWGF